MGDNTVCHCFVFQSRFVQEPFNLEVVEAGDSSGFHQPLGHQLLHSFLGSEECYFTSEDIALIVFREKSFPGCNPCDQ